MLIDSIYRMKPNGLEIMYYPDRRLINKCVQGKYVTDCKKLMEDGIKYFGTNINITVSNLCEKEYFNKQQYNWIKHRKVQNTTYIFVLQGSGKLKTKKGNSLYNINIRSGILVKMDSLLMENWSYTINTFDRICTIVYKTLPDKNTVNKNITISLILNNDSKKRKAMVTKNRFNIAHVEKIARNKFMLADSSNLIFYKTAGIEIKKNHLIKHQDIIYVSQGEPYMGPMKVNKLEDFKEPILEHQVINKWYEKWNKQKMGNYKFSTNKGMYLNLPIYSVKEITETYKLSSINIKEIYELIYDIKETVESNNLYWSLSYKLNPLKSISLYITDIDDNYIEFNLSDR